MAKVVLRGISKVYPGGVTAVKDVSLDVADKEFVVLVGPSGCGKSTCLRMIAGLETITRGEIYIGETLVNDVLPKDRDIAMVFQNYALYPHMTVRANLAFGLKLRKYPPDEIVRRVTDAAEILEIRQFLERKPKALSGGQRQRVAVGRAIVRKPKVFLFDEPLSNLDAKLRVQMRAEINKLHKKLQATMIYVTHDQVEAMTMGDRIVVMKDGVIHQIDAPLALYLRPVDKFVAGFIGSPPMNFMDGTIRRQGGALRFESGTFRARVADRHVPALSPYADRPLAFGIRPEDIRIRGEDGEGEDRFTARIEVIEPMGSEMYIHFVSGDCSFLARVPPREKTAVGDELALAFDMSKAHFFDPETEKAIK
ncbi:MAG: sn-glycerol-3-phosphate ABC transporter ATP-binding protein UgpC [Candidatus Aureabacteria bacterium]|nr:sn-glycerol-3-phosphate ABC transporter ATP-binding protein UgpC [Candidatus Auribacterota bacterium]